MRPGVCFGAVSVRNSETLGDRLSVVLCLIMFVRAGRVFLSSLSRKPHAVCVRTSDVLWRFFVEKDDIEQEF